MVLLIDNYDSFSYNLYQLIGEINPDIKVMIKNGQVEGTGSQSPNTLGFDSMVAAFKLLSGEEVEHKIDVDTFLITAENVDEFGTDGWQ